MANFIGIIPNLIHYKAINERKFSSPKKRAKSLMAAVLAVLHGYEHIHLFDEISELSF